MVGRFRSDRRIHAWDLFNEPDNPNRSSYGKLEPAGKPGLSLALLEKTFAWVRAVEPSQPMTAGVWQGNLTDPDRLSPINRYMLTQSDVISFHNYRPLAELKKDVEALKRYRRPIAVHRVHGPPGRAARSSRSCRISRSEHVGAYNWGFVAGKSQTIYPWDSWQKPYAAEPPVWFHDIFRPDGTPYIAGEVAFIRGVTGKRPRRTPVTGSGSPAMNRDIRPLTPEDLAELGRFLTAGFHAPPMRISPRPRCCAGSTLETGGVRDRQTYEGAAEGALRRPMRSPSEMLEAPATSTIPPGSYVARDESGRIIGHLGLCRTAFEGQALASAGGRVGTIHIIDWLGSPEHKAVGMSLMRLAHQGVATQFGLGVSQAALVVGERAGYELRSLVPAYTRVLRASYWLRAGGLSPWQRGLRLARDAANRLIRPPAAPRAVIVPRRVSAFGPEIVADHRGGRGARDYDEPGPGAAQRVPPIPAAGGIGLASARRRRAGSAGWPILNLIPKDGGRTRTGKVVDCVLDGVDVDLWHAAFAALTRELASQGADIAQAYGSTPWSAEALRRGGYTSRFTVKFHIRDRQGLIPRDVVFHITPLEGDYGYT